jgi:uncharacterized OsmC-like protein
MATIIKGEYEGELRNKIIHQGSNTILFTDAPLDNQGKGESFSPTDLLAGALASCMATIIAIKAKTKSIQIGKPKYTAIKNMGINPRKIDNIQIEIQFFIDLKQKEKDFLEFEAKNCPVALSLSSNLRQEVNFKYLN